MRAINLNIQANIINRNRKQEVLEENIHAKGSDVVINKLNYYLTREDIESIARITVITGKKINIEKHFFLYIVYNLLINNKDNMDKKEIISNIEDKIVKYNTTYKQLKAQGITDKAIFIFFFYKNSISKNYSNLKRMFPCDPTYFIRKSQEKLKFNDMVYTLSITKNNQKEIIQCSSMDIPDQLNSILSQANNQSHIKLNDSSIEVIKKYTKPIFVNGYYVDILYIKNGDKELINNMINKYKCTSNHLVTQIQLSYGDNVSCYSKIVSENQKDPYSQSLLGIIYNRTFDGSIFHAGDNMIGVIVIHKHILLPKSYEYFQKKQYILNNLIVSTFIESYP